MPNEQGGFTYEEEQEFIARQMAAANWQPPPEVNPTPEQQAQQVERALREGYISQAGGTPTSPEQQGLLDTMGTMVLGIGPPYAESPRPYSGPPPMEAQPDWNYDSGYPGDWQDFSSNNTTTGGGFFTLDDVFHAQGRAVPQSFSSGSERPSTNNWRLLPPEYRNPRFIMRNGHIIDTQGGTNYGPMGGSHTMGTESAGGYPKWRSGAAVGMPVAFAPSSISWGVSGWPGQLDPYQWHSTSGT